MEDLETLRPLRARGAYSFTFIIFLVRRVTNSLPAGRVEKNEPIHSAKGHPEMQDVALNRNEIASGAKNTLRENLVCSDVYRLLTLDTRKK